MRSLRIPEPAIPRWLGQVRGRRAGKAFFFFLDFSSNIKDIQDKRNMRETVLVTPLRPFSDLMKVKSSAVHLLVKFYSGGWRTFD